MIEDGEATDLGVGVGAKGKQTEVAGGGRCPSVQLSVGAWESGHGGEASREGNEGGEDLGHGKDGGDGICTGDDV